MQDEEDAFFSSMDIQGKQPKYAELLKFKVGAKVKAAVRTWSPDGKLLVMIVRVPTWPEGSYCMGVEGVPRPTLEQGFLPVPRSGIAMSGSKLIMPACHLYKPAEFWCWH